MIGNYLPFYDVPQTGYIQRSTDRCQTWSAPVPVMEPGKFLVIPKRLRLLKDGRAVLTGGFVSSSSEDRTPGETVARLMPTMWISSDAGQTWSEPIVVLPAAEEEDVSLTEECDFAELPDGSLLFITRVDASAHKRWQSLLRSAEATRRIMAEEMLAPSDEETSEAAQPAFAIVSAGPAPFPHSGHPEMLWAREGVALHLATTGIHWTGDGGESWHDLGIGGTGYYPRSVQLPDGRIFCVYHRGGDNPYDGSVDQEIQAMTFRLEVEE